MSKKKRKVKSFEYKFTKHDINRQEKWFEDREQIYRENIKKVFHSKKEPCHAELKYNANQRKWKKEWIN